MKINASKVNWFNLLKLVLVVCSFFWWGWKVGLLMLLMTADYVPLKK